MIPKFKAPHLNRAQRRHPARLLQAPTLPAGSGMPWLLYGLLQRGGYLVGNPLPPTAPIVRGPNDESDGFIARASRFFRKLIGR